MGMMMTFFNWEPNIVVSSTFLSMMKGVSQPGTFGLYAGLCFLGWVFVIFCYSEAANMTMEEVREVLITWAWEVVCRVVEKAAE